MSKLLFTVRVVVRHSPYTLAFDQHDPILEEIPYTLTARTEREVEDHILDDANKEGWTIKQVHLEITDKQETR